MTNASAPQHWSTWSSARGYPLSSEEEAQLIEEMRSFEGTKPKRNPKVLTDRHVASLLLTMLRDGTTLEDILEITPNLNPKDLVATYERLAESISEAREAWARMMDDPATGEVESETAGLIMPYMVNALRGSEGVSRTELATRMNSKVAEATTKINELEQRMHGAKTVTERCNLHYSLVRADSCLWDDALFLPSRVGQLTPTRLAFILKDHS